MGFILKFLGGPLGTYALIAVGVLLAGSFAYGTYEHLQLKVASADLKSKERDLQIVVRSNNSKDVVIEAQKLALEEWSKFADDEDKKQKEAVAQVEVLTEAHRVADARIHELEKKDYELPDCAKYLALNVAVVCPAHSSGLRARQSGGDYR